MLRGSSSTAKRTASGESGDVDRGRGPADDGEAIPTSASKKRTRRRKPTRYISKRQATNLIAALEFANRHRLSAERVRRYCVGVLLRDR